MPLNPGYPPPRNVRIVLSNGVTLPVDTTFDTVIFDRGVPTPRWLLILPDDLDVVNHKVERLEYDWFPPGAILAFNQLGNAAENAERIVGQSVRAQYDKLIMKRTDQ